MAISKLLFAEMIDDLIENIKAHPGDTAKYRREVCEKIRNYVSSQKQSTLASVFVSLYCGQIRALKRDIVKCCLAGSKDASQQERAELLRCLFGALNLYFHEDYSLLIDMCESELERRARSGEGIEDPEEELLAEQVY